MNWVIYAILSVLLVGSFNSFLQGTKQNLPKGYIYTHIYLCLILITVGLFGAIYMAYYQYKSPTEVHKMFSKHILFPYLTVIIPATLLFIYLQTNTLALIGGGGIAMALINLNMFVTIMAGVFLFNDKINVQILLSMFVGVLSMGYAVKESKALNKT